MNTPGFNHSRCILLFCGCFISVLSNHSITFAQDIGNLKNTKPFEMKGSLSATSIFYNIKGREAYREPFSWILRGDPVFYIYGVTIPITIVVSEQERDFRQPFNRFGISPYYKWAKLNLGYQNLQYSKYSMAGHAMVGAGVELNPGKLRFGYMHGSLLRAVQASAFVDDQDFRVVESFKRIGDVVKLGYGSDQNYVDLVILKGHDLLNSLDSIPVGSSLLPAENLVGTLKVYQKVFKKVLVEMEYAQSIYTEDIRAESSSYANSTFSLLGSLTDIKTSTDFNSAFYGAIQYQGETFFGGVNFERIDPGYRSMGAYFFLDDVQRITVTPGVKLLHDNIQIKTSFGYQQNNLENTKEQRTIRRVGSIMLTARAGQVYQFTGNYSNFGVEQKEGFMPVDPTTNLAQVSQQWSMNHSFTFQKETLMQNVNININSQVLNDENEMTKEFSDYESMVYSGNYMISFIPIKFSINAGYTLTQFNVAQQDIRYAGPSMGINKSFFKNKLQTAINANFFSNNTNEVITRKTTRITFRSSYKVTLHHKLSVRAQLGKSDYPDQPDKSYQETKFELSYGYRF